MNTTTKVNIEVIRDHEDLLESLHFALLAAGIGGVE